MLKKYYKPMFLVLSFIILLIIIYNQYEENKMYEGYISEHLNREMQQLVDALVQSDNLYQEILQDENITMYQADMLNTYSNRLIELAQKYERLAVLFNRMESNTMSNEIVMNAEEISYFFHTLRGRNSQTLQENEIDDVIHKLDNHPELELRNKIKELLVLNALWVEVAERYVVGLTISEDGDVSFDSLAFINYMNDESLSDNFWIDLIKDLDQITNDYLKEKQIESVGEILYY